MQAHAHKLGLKHTVGACPSNDRDLVVLQCGELWFEIPISWECQVYKELLASIARGESADCGEARFAELETVLSDSVSTPALGSVIINFFVFGQLA